MGLGGGTVALPSPRTPQAAWAATTLLTVPSVTADSSKWRFYLRPAAVTRPPEASLPLWWLAPTVARRPWHLQPQLATGLGEGHPGGGRIGLDCKDEVVLQLSVPVPAPSPAPRALTGLVEVQREVGGPVDVVPPARLHPGRGVGEDVNVVMLQGVCGLPARLKPLARPGHRVAGGGERGHKVRSRWDSARPLGGLGMRRAHVPVCPYVSQSGHIPWAPQDTALIPAAVPDSPERQEVGGIAVGAAGRPGAEERAGAALLPAGEAGGDSSA